MSNRDEQLLLNDIFEAGTKILRYTKGYSYTDFLNDERTMEAVIRNFEIKGEASKRISNKISWIIRNLIGEKC